MRINTSDLVQAKGILLLGNRLAGHPLKRETIQEMMVIKSHDT